MKKLFLMLTLGFLTLTAVNAQDHSGRMHGKKHEGKEMGLEKLNLSEDQKSKLKSINMDFRNQMQELQKNENITVKEMKSRREQLQAAHKAKIQSVLTSDQKSQLAKMKEEHQAQGKMHQEKRMEMMKEKLALTDQQTTRLKAMHEDMAQKTKAIKENKNLSDAEKRAQLKEMQKQHKEKMKTVFTEEQLKKLKENGRKNEAGHKKHAVK